MIFSNLNLITTTIFILFIIISFFVFRLYFKEYLISQNRERFFAVIFLLISFLILSVWIFWIKFLKLEKNIYVWTNITFVLDVSKSMKALDFEKDWKKYSRLDICKKLINDFVEKNKWNRYSLVVFAWETQRVLPFTNDVNLFSTILFGIDENNVSKQWTDLKNALIEWMNNFTGEDDYGLLVLFSDWDDDNILSSVDLRKIKQKTNVNKLVVWVWNKNWSNIPEWINLFWEDDYKMYNWEAVITKLNEDNLINIASILDWYYYNLGEMNNYDLINKVLADSISKTYYSKSENYFDLTRFFVFLSFIFFLLYLAFIIKHDENK